MKKLRIFLVFIGVACSFSFAAHKFYTAIYQIDFVPKKQMVQITARIFHDDLNDALEHKFKTKTFLGTDKETAEDLALLKKYLAEKFTVKINGKTQPMHFHGKDLEDNVMLCYLSCKDIAKVNSLEVQNSILTEIHPEQQNIIQANFNGKKSSLLLGLEKTTGMLK